MTGCSLRIWTCVLVVGVASLTTPAHGGIYFAFEKPLLPLPSEFREITFRLLDLRSIAAEKVNEETPQRVFYRKMLARLEAREREGLLLFDERIDLGACYLRLLKYREAKRVLEAAEKVCTRDNMYRFLMLANLAVTYQGLAETEQQATYYDQAIAYQRQMLAAWPELYPNWQLWQNQSYRRAELFCLRLLESRRKEVIRQAGPRAFQWHQYDDLFEGVEFAGPDGDYQIGGIAFASWDKLPVDAPQLVLQLLFWFPYDDRLYWLYGEVLNTRNQVLEAFLIFDDLVGKKKLRFRELMRHHLALREPAQGRLALNDQVSRQPTTLLLALMAVAPRGSTLAWGAGAACLESAWPVLAELYASQNNVPGEQPSPPIAPRVQFEWQPVFVGFAAGVLVGSLVLLQIRQWRLRLGNRVNDRRIQEG